MQVPAHLRQRAGQMATTVTVTRASGLVETRVQAYWSRSKFRTAVVQRLLERGHVLTERHVYTEHMLGLLWRLVKGHK